jgi:pimeloyl-ACP methyl ester carboxylesterase
MTKSFRRAFLGAFLAVFALLGLSAVAAWSGTSTSKYSPVPGVELEYVVARPVGAPAPVPVWIYQPGDGAVLEDSGPITRYGFSTLLANVFRVAFIWPQLRREIYADDLKSYCELDFLHRVTDLDALIDEVKRLPGVDPERIALVAVSAGSEIATRAARARGDIRAVVTVGGGVLQLMDALVAEGNAGWTEAAMAHVCSPGSYRDRSGTFWRQLLLSGLEEDIRASTVPYLALVGSEDEICKASTQTPHAREMEKVRPGFRYEVVQGLGHGPGYRLDAWKRIRDFIEAQFTR